jgi:hypothetical protein
MSKRLSPLLTRLLALVGLAIVGIPAAQAMQNQNETGSFDCSCSGGHGTCTLTSTTTGTTCLKINGATCTGQCTMTVTPDSPKASIQKSPLKSAPGVNLKRQ